MRPVTAPVEAPAAGDRMVLGGGALVATFVVIAIIAAFVDPQPNWVDASSLHAILAAAAVVIAFTAGCLGIVRWRLVGDAISLRVGVALGVLGMSFVVVDLASVLVPSLDRRDALGIAGTAFTLTARGLLVVAVLSVATNKLTSLRGQLVVAAASVVVVCVLVWFVPALDAFRRTSAGPLDNASDWIARGTLILVWLGLAASSFLRWRRTTARLFGWIGIMCAGFALAAIVGAVATSREDLWVTAATVCTTSAALVALYGMGHALKQAYLEQQASLFDARLLAEERAARLRAEAADRDERAHQARSAVFALQGATRMLCDSDDRRDAPMDQDLREAIETEIEVLRRILERHQPDGVVAFDLERVVRNVVTAQRLLGLVAECSVVPGLCVTGRATETAEVIQAVLDNARRHAPGSPVEIRAVVRHELVEVHVEDRGPGLDEALLDALFERSVSASQPAGDGLGLYVARRLMRSQGGDLRAERRAGGGAEFVVTLRRP